MKVDKETLVLATRVADKKIGAETDFSDDIELALWFLRVTREYNQRIGVINQDGQDFCYGAAALVYDNLALFSETTRRAVGAYIQRVKYGVLLRSQMPSDEKAMVPSLREYWWRG